MEHAARSAKAEAADASAAARNFRQRAAALPGAEARALLEDVAEQAAAARLRERAEQARLCCVVCCAVLLCCCVFVWASAAFVLWSCSCAVFLWLCLLPLARSLPGFAVSCCSC